MIMDKIAVDLAEYLKGRLHSIGSDARLLVGISGVPASGKSTLVQLIVDHINATTSTAQSAQDGTRPVESLEANEVIAVAVGLDGWHLTRAQLDQLPDPKLAHDRRGAHWTFDGDSYVEFVKALRAPRGSEIIYAPSFDHAVKDPTPQAVQVLPCHRIIIIEGLYTFLGIPPWRTAAEMLDERWWIDISEEEAERRLVVRHVRSGIAKDVGEAIWRSRENDAPNGRFIRENMLEPTRVIQSIEDPAYSP